MPYVVIFESHKHRDDPAYFETAYLMESLAQNAKGYLHHVSFRHADGHGVTLSYWSSLKDIKTWKNQVDHRLAQEKGQADWYKDYAVQVSKIEYTYQTSGFSSYAELFKE